MTLAAACISPKLQMRASWNGFYAFADMALARTSGKRRPALWTALCFGAGVILAHYVTIPPALLIVLSLLLVLVALIAALKGRNIPSLLLGMLLVLGVFRFGIATARDGKLSRYIGFLLLGIYLLYLILNVTVDKS